MMPGRRVSDDIFGMLAALGTLVLILVMAWASVIFVAASSAAFFVHVLRWWGAA